MMDGRPRMMITAAPTSFSADEILDLAHMDGIAAMGAFRCHPRTAKLLARLKDGYGDRRDRGEHVGNRRFGIWPVIVDHRMRHMRPGTPIIRFEAFDGWRRSLVLRGA